MVRCARGVPDLCGALGRQIYRKKGQHGQRRRGQGECHPSARFRLPTMHHFAFVQCTTAFVVTALSARSNTLTVMTCSDASAAAGPPCVFGGSCASKSKRSVSESAIWPTGAAYCHGPASMEY